MICLFNLLIFEKNMPNTNMKNIVSIFFWKYEIKGSNNYYKFNLDLIEDKDVKKELNNKKENTFS